MNAYRYKLNSAYFWDKAGRMECPVRIELINNGLSIHFANHYTT